MLGCPTTATPDAATPMNDAFVPPGTDGGPVNEDTGATALPVIQTGTRAAPLPAMLACANTATSIMPMGGAPVSGVLNVAALGLSPTPVASTAIQVYTGAGVATGCAAPGCQTVTTDATGNAMISLPSGGWFAYRVPSNAASVPGLGFFYTWGTAAGSTTAVTAISGAAADIVAGQLNRELNSSTAAVSGSVRDCAGANMANLQIRMFRGDTEIISGARAETMTPRISGVGDTAIPMPTPNGLTSFAGRFAGVLPSAGGDIRIEAWGVPAAGGTQELVACEVVSVEPASVTVAVLGPYRSDYAAGSPCAGRRAM
jgi:hypothetical protein